MNKVMIRKPLAMLLAFVMLFSSAVVNIPAFAFGPATEIVEGDDIISDYLGLSGVSHVYLKESGYTYGGTHDWVLKNGWFGRQYWSLEFIPGIVEVLTPGVEISSTAYLAPGTYAVVLLGDYSLVYDELLDEDVGIAEILGEYSLTVTTNQAPQPVSGEDLTFDFEINEDEAFEMNLIQFFEDLDLHAIRITGSNSADSITHDDTHIRFTPVEDWNGDVTGTFTVSDERAFNEKEITATINIKVKPVNDPPVIVEESYSTPMNTDVTIVNPALNDTDPEATTVSLVGSVTVPANQGTMNGLVFTPFNGFTGDAELTYVITDTPTDGTLAIEVTGKVTVNVFVPGEENFSPVAKDDTVTTTVGTPVTVYPLGNDTDAEDDVTPVALVLTDVTILTDVDGDSISFTPGDDFFNYTPNAEFVNTVLVEYTVTDSDLATDKGLVSIHINVPTVDDIVSALPDVLEIDEDTVGQVDVTTNDSFPDGFGSIVLDIHDPDLNATIVNDTEIRIEPNSNVTGDFTIHYTVYDTDDDFDSSVLEVTVNKIERPDYIFEGELFIYTKINEEGTVDVAPLTYPAYFDVNTLVVLDVAFKIPAESSNGITDQTDTFAKYKPNSMVDVTLVFTATDAFGHIAKGDIKVLVLSDASTDYIIPHDMSSIRVNQYSDPESIRLDVEYHTNDGFLPEFKFELPEYAPNNFPTGFYEFNKRDDNGKFISITKYFGEFLVRYGMENDGDDLYAAIQPLRPVSINGQPLIGMEEVDPKDIDYGFTPIELNVVPIEEPEEPLEWVYASEDIFDYLYGYDFEDYRHGGLDPALNMSDMMPMLFDDVEPAAQGKVRIEFRLNGTEESAIYDISDFWKYVVVGHIDENNGYKENPLASVESGVDGEIDYTIYNIQFMMTDSEGFSSNWTEPWMLKVLNEAPVIVDTQNEPFDEFVVIQTGDAIEFGSMINIEDDEDENFAQSPYDYLLLPLVHTQDELLVEVFDANTGAPIWSRDGMDVPEPDTAFDTNMPGVFRVVFTYTDIHGLNVEEELELWIVPESLVDVDLEALEMELGGYFPTFMGVTANFWHPSDSMFTVGLENGNEPHHYNGDIVQYVSAMMDGAEIGRVYVEQDFRPVMMMEEFDNFGEVYRFTTEEIATITYHAVQEVYDDGEWFVVTSNPVPAGDMATSTHENNYMRVVTVTDDDFGDYFITSDIGDMLNMPEYPGPMRNEFVGEKYPVVSKYKFVEGEDGDELVGRIVTTILEEAIPELDSMNDMALSTAEMAHRFFTFLDLAETFDGQIYGLSTDQRLWVYNTNTGAFRELVDLNQMSNMPGLTDEIRDLFDEERQEEISIGFMPVLSLTGDKDGNLVMLLSVSAYLSGEFNDMYNVIFVLSPLGEIISLDVTDTQDGYPLVNDIAYDEELEVLYGIGTKLFLGDEASSMSVANISEYYDQELFKLEMVEEPEEPEPTDIGLMVYEGRYMTTVIDDLEESHYSGIAVVNEEIILTKFNPDMMYPSMYMPMFDEYSYVDVLDLDGLALSEDHMIPDRFTWSFGAAAKFNKEMTIAVNPSSIISGGTSTVLVNISPVNAFSGEPVWSHNGSGSLVDPPALTATTIDENGNMTMTYQSVAGTAETVKVTVVFDGITRDVTINVSNPFVPTPDPSPQPSAPATAPAPTPTIGVTLDTDAITLDYGETADPNFTSFDFTETVTGTTNTNVTWSLSDDTFVSVDANGLVTADGNIPVDTGDITVTLTVTTVDGGATATATIIFEEQTPLGAIEFFEPYVSGYSDGTFRENAVVTRAEVASMFARILRLNRSIVGTQKFTDVSDEHWAYGSIQAMYNTGMFSGYLADDGSRYFDPNAAISRSEIAQVFTNYWNLLDISVTSEIITPIPDVVPTYWASPAINRIFNTGIFSGFEDGTFRPEDPTLRGQIVSMINRLIARPANEADTSSFLDILLSSEFFGDIEAASRTFLNTQGN